MYQNFIPYPDPMYIPGARLPMPEFGKMELARAYVPDQPYVGIFPVEEAIYKGTVFPNLHAAFPPPIGPFDNRRR